VNGAEPNRVLVVDDERAITDLVAMALKYEGFSVQTAATAKQARHAVMDFRPDLMILDVGLPDDDGFTLVQRLISDGIKVPVIFLTARDATEEKVHGLTIGGDEEIDSPVDLSFLDPEPGTAHHLTQCQDLRCGALRLRSQKKAERREQVVRLAREDVRQLLTIVQRLQPRKLGLQPPDLSKLLFGQAAVHLLLGFVIRSEGLVCRSRGFFPEVGDLLVDAFGGGRTDIGCHAARLVQAEVCEALQLRRAAFL